MIITKEMFLKAIDFIKKKDKQEEKLCDVLEELCPGEYVNAFIFSDYRKMLLDTLSYMLDDDADIITYKMYEFDSFSDEYKKQQLELTPELETWETIYDYLIKHMEEK